MINKPESRLGIWTIIGLGVFGISFLVGLFIPETRSFSPSIAYQEAMLGIIVSIFKLIGSFIILISIPLYMRKAKKKRNLCPNCGATPLSPNDKFCRVCGEPLSA
jgi:hypothetical protein